MAGYEEAAAQYSTIPTGIWNLWSLVSTGVLDDGEGVVCPPSFKVLVIKGPLMCGQLHSLHSMWLNERIKPQSI